MNLEYKEKYLKYKRKYLELKQIAGAKVDSFNIKDQDKNKIRIIASWFANYLVRKKFRAGEAKEFKKLLENKKNKIYKITNKEKDKDIEKMKIENLFDAFRIREQSMKEENKNKYEQFKKQFAQIKNELVLNYPGVWSKIGSIIAEINKGYFKMSERYKSAREDKRKFKEFKKKRKECCPQGSLENKYYLHIFKQKSKRGNRQAFKG